MGLFVGTFQVDSSKVATETVAITGVGFQPTAIMAWAYHQTGLPIALNDNATFAAGFSDGTNEFWWSGFTSDNVDDTGAYGGIFNTGFIGNHVWANIDWEITIDSFDADGFTYEVSNQASANIQVLFICFDGASHVGSFTGHGTAETQAYSGVGFQPEALLFGTSGQDGINTMGGAEWRGYMLGMASASDEEASMSIMHRDNTANPQVTTTLNDDECITLLQNNNTLDGRASLDSFDADGFTLDWTDACATAQIVPYLALAGMEYNVGMFTVDTSTGNQAITGVGFTPSLVLMGWNNQDDDVPGTLDQDDGANNPMAYLVGVTDGTKEYVFGIHSNDASATGNNNIANIHRDDYFYASYSTARGPAKVGSANIVSLDSDGFTINWDDASPQANEVIFMCFGEFGGEVFVAGRDGGISFF